jgi:hypothetical protein
LEMHRLSRFVSVDDRGLPPSSVRHDMHVNPVVVFDKLRASLFSGRRFSVWLVRL